MSESNQPTGDQGNGRSDAVPGSGSAYGYGITPPGAAPAPEPAATPGPAPAPGSAAEHAVPSGSDPAGTPGPAAWGPAARGPSAPSAPAAPAPEAVGAGNAPAAGAQPPSAAQVGATLRKVGIGTPVPTLVIGALAYVVALGAALVVIASAILSVLTLDPGGTPDPTGGAAAPSADDAGFEGLIGLLGIPFQLVALACFGSYDAELGMGFFGTMTLSWRGLPLLITVAMTAVAFLAARSAQRRWSSNGPLGAAVWSGLSGFGVALFAVLATRLTAFSIEDDSIGLTLSMHSAGADMFFGTWALITLPLLLGHLAGMRKPAWWPLVADLAAAPRLALVHALVFALPVGILALAGGAIAQIADGEGQSVLGMLLSLPIWGLTALGLLPGLGMLVVPVRASARGDVESLGLDRTQGYLWFFDLPWYVWVPMVLIALLVPLLMALLWHRDREIPGNAIAQVTSWAALPLAYTACSLVLLALVPVTASAEMGMLGYVGVSLSLALWMPVVAFVIGLAVEVLARFGAPFADRFVPGVLVNWFRRSARARRADGTATAQTRTRSDA